MAACSAVPPWAATAGLWAVVIALAVAYLAIAAARSGGFRDGPWIAGLLVAVLAVAAVVVWISPARAREGFEAPDDVPMAASGHVPPMPKGMRLRAYYSTLSAESFSPREAWHMTDLAGKHAPPPARLSWTSVLHAGTRSGEPPALNRGTMGLNVRDYKGALELARTMPESTREYSMFVMMRIDPGQWTSSVTRAPILGISSHGNTRNVGVSLFVRLDASSRTVFMGLEHGCENTEVSSSTAGACDAGNNYVGEVSNQYMFEPAAVMGAQQRPAPRFADGEFHLITVVRSVNTDGTVHTLELFVDEDRALSVHLPVRTDVRSKPTERFAEDARLGLGMFVNEQGVVPMSVVALGTYDVALSVPDMQEIAAHLRGNMLIHTDAVVRAILEESHRSRPVRNCTFDEETCEACPDVTSWADAESLLAAGAECQRKVVRACGKEDAPAMCRELTRDRALRILQAVSPSDYLSLVNLMTARESTVRDASVDRIELDKNTRAADAPPTVHSGILESVLMDRPLPAASSIASFGRRAADPDGLRYVAPVTTATESAAMVDVGAAVPAADSSPVQQDAYDRIIDRFHRETLGSGGGGSAAEREGILETLGGLVESGMESVGRLFSWGS